MSSPDHVTDTQKRYTGNASTDVTDTRKCYIFACAACGMLQMSSRSDALTCSPACRVKAHRTGQIKLLKARALAGAIVDERTGKPRPCLLLQAQALNRLLPDLANAVMRGDLTIDQAQPRMVKEFTRLVFEAIHADRQEVR